MNAGVIELLAFGLVAIVSGLLLLASMVRELAPHERRQWLLGIGLGTGIITFSLKIGLIVLFSLFPEPILSVVADREYAHAPPDAAPAPGHRSPLRRPGYTWEALPRSAPYPPDNPPSAEKIDLGRMLFFDKRLSVDGSLSCASCHDLSTQKGGADGLRTSIGIAGQQGHRNAPSVLNAAFQQVLFWDGRAASLEAQAEAPLINPVEMGMPSLDSVVERVRAVPEYRRAFRQVFATASPVTIGNIAKAIAAFERTLITPDSPYDRFVRGDSTALSEQQLRGMALFEAMGCIVCHSGANFSGASVFGNDAPYRIFPTIPSTEFEMQYQLTRDPGAARHLVKPDRGVWRIPSLRNVSRTAPYFHNGSVTSLKEAIRIMARVQLNKRLSNGRVDDTSVSWSKTNRQLSVSANQAISDAEVDDIAAFLESLNGELPAGY